MGSLEQQALNVGVLALQGSFSEHISVLQSLQISTRTLNVTAIRTPAELAQVTALIIPGGESTAISLLAREIGLLEPLREFAEQARDGNKTIWGTCAGMIMLAKDVAGAKDGWQGLRAVDAKVVRNQYGRQSESFTCDLHITGLQDASKPFKATFIRAPVLHSILPRASTSPQVQVLARVPFSRLPKVPSTSESLGPDADIVMLRQGNLLMTSFHPELGGDNRVHEWWIQELALSTSTS